LIAINAKLMQNCNFYATALRPSVVYLRRSLGLYIGYGPSVAIINGASYSKSYY